MNDTNNNNISLLLLSDNYSQYDAKSSNNINILNYTLYDKLYIYLWIYLLLFSIYGIYIRYIFKINHSTNEIELYESLLSNDTYESGSDDSIEGEPQMYSEDI